MFYLMEGTRYEMSIDPEQSNISYFSKQFDLTEKTPQKEKVKAILSQPKAGDELSLDLVLFKPYSSLLEPSSETELKRLVRVVKANPQLKFDIEVNLDGYLQDTTMSDPDLTESLLDSVQVQISSLDSLGNPATHDSLVVKQRFHNDRTLKQGQAICEYLISQGVDKNSITYIGNTMPATTPPNRKLVIKAVARSR